MPPALVGGVLSVAAKIAAAKTFAIGFAVAAKAFLVGAVVTFAGSELTKRFAKKPSLPGVASGSGVAGSSRDLTGSTIPVRWVVGKARVTGGIVWLREVDKNNFAYVAVLSAGACDGIERVWAHGEEVVMRRDGNVLTPDRTESGKYWGVREESYTETYTERVPTGSGGDGRETGPTAPASGPGRAGACGGCRSDGRSSSACAACGPGRNARIASDGQYDDPIFTQRSGFLDMSPWALARYNDAVASAASAGAMASASGDGVSGQQGEQGEGGGRVDPPTRPPRDSGYTYVQRTRTRTREVPVPLIKITEFFKADGTEGDAVRAIAAGVEDGELAWTDAHRGEGVSYVLVELFQPDYTDIDDRFWPGAPTVEFLLRGLKIGYPVKREDGGFDLTEPAWTRNAAIIRWWYLTERRSIPPQMIDLDYFESARLLCDTDLRLSEQARYRAEYPESVKRYTIDGSINSGDSAAALDTQFDFAWQGFVVEHSGRLLFRPGADQPVKFTITEDDIIADPVVRPFGSRADLANELSMRIEQSSGKDYQREHFVVVDSEAQGVDGERLPQELSEQRFVTEPVQAVNLLTQRLRQQRGLVSVELQVKSPPDWRYLRLVAGDKIALRIPEHGIGVGGARLHAFRVTGVQVNDDFSVALNLLEWPDGLYDDQFDFPPRQPKFGYRLRPIPAPVGRGSIDWNIAQDGTVVWTAFLSWDATPYETFVSVVGELTTGQSVSTQEHSVSIELTQAGRHTFSLYHRSTSGLVSPVSQVVLDATYADIPLPRPVVTEARQNGNTILFVIDNIPNRDIAGLEVRYRVAGLDESFADIPVITEAEWEGALQMNVSPVTAARGDGELFAQALLPASGTYRIHVRFRNRVGNLSPLSDSITARYEIAATATGSVTGQPRWEGERNNVLVWEHDGEARLYAGGAQKSLVTFDQWNGDGNFPFGDHIGREHTGMPHPLVNSTTYKIEHDFEAAGEGRATRELYVAIDSVAPAGKTGSSPPGFVITLRVRSGGGFSTYTVADGAVQRFASVDAAEAWVNFAASRNRVLSAVTLGWREIE